MRYFSLLSALALSVAALQPLQAAAQQSGSPMADLLDTARRATDPVQWAATRPTPLSNLTRAARDWIKAETQRQADAPRPTIQVSISIDEALDRPMGRLARDMGVHKRDVSNAILLKIMIDAQTILALEQREARRTQASTAGDQEMAARLARAEVDRKEAMDVQSDTSLSLVMM